MQPNDGSKPRIISYEPPVLPSVQYQTPSTTQTSVDSVTGQQIVITNDQEVITNSQSVNTVVQKLTTDRVVKPQSTVKTVEMKSSETTVQMTLVVENP